MNWANRLFSVLRLKVGLGKQGARFLILKQQCSTERRQGEAVEMSLHSGGPS